jgi:hypothetical protein
MSSGVGQLSYRVTMDSQRRTNVDRANRMIVHYAVFGGLLTLASVCMFRWSNRGDRGSAFLAGIAPSHS